MAVIISIMGSFYFLGKLSAILETKKKTNKIYKS
jgi:hypothetical protein